MLGQRRRRCANVVQMLYKCFLFAGGLAPPHKQCWFSVVNDGPTFNRHWFNVLCWLEYLLTDLIKVVKTVELSVKMISSLANYSYFHITQLSIDQYRMAKCQ